MIFNAAASKCLHPQNASDKGLRLMLEGKVFLSLFEKTPHGQTLGLTLNHFHLARLCRWSRNAFWINILNLFRFLLLYFFCVPYFFFFFLSRLSRKEPSWKKKYKFCVCKKKYVRLQRLWIMRVESEKCEIAGENCNLGSVRESMSV